MFYLIYIILFYKIRVQSVPYYIKIYKTLDCQISTMQVHNYFQFKENKCTFFPKWIDLKCNHKTAVLLYSKNNLNFKNKLHV